METDQRPPRVALAPRMKAGISWENLLLSPKGSVISVRIQEIPMEGIASYRCCE